MKLILQFGFFFFFFFFFFFAFKKVPYKQQLLFLLLTKYKQQLSIISVSGIFFAEKKLALLCEKFWRYSVFYILLASGMPTITAQVFNFHKL